MVGLRQPRIVRWAIFVVIALVLGAWATPSSPPQARRGWPVYERLCLPCHGILGDGHGPWLSITLVDARGRPVAGATDRHRIGRDIWFDGTWHERTDTRIPPGETITVARAWTAGRTADATAARIAIEVHPDDFYERFYTEKLAGTVVPAQRALYQQALARALGSHYVAEQRDVPIAP